MPTAGKRPVRGQEMTAARAEAKKSEKKEAGDKRSGAVKCPNCMMPMTSYANLKVHYESKHPKLTCPEESELK